jgi:hypothetical protein
MRTMSRGVLFAAFLVLPGQANAGKVDNVKNAVKEACNRDVPAESVLSAVVRAYDCEPGHDVTIAGCKIKCLKNADGNVVGK